MLFKGKYVGWKGTRSIGLEKNEIYLVQILYDHARKDPAERITDKYLSPIISESAVVYDVNLLSHALYTKHCKIGRIESESGEIVDSVKGIAHKPFTYTTGEIIKGEQIYFYPNSMPGGEIEAKKRAWSFVYYYHKQMKNRCHWADHDTQNALTAIKAMPVYSRTQKEPEEKEQSFAEWIEQRKKG